MRRLVCVGSLLGLLLAGCAEPGVVRVVEGRALSGRYISPYAYLLYAIAADAEAHGDFAAALDMYASAAEEDADSPEIWTRIGAMRCKLEPQGSRSGSTEEAFERAREIDPSYEPLAREEATCALQEGKVDRALERARRARELDPTREETGLLLASLLEKVGRVKEAQRELRALTVLRPTSAPAWRALLGVSARLGDAAAAAQASERLSELVKTSAAPSATTPSKAAALTAIDDALSSDDLERARKLGRAGRIAGSEIAVRAAALGRCAAARAQAELVLGADPSETSARIALAVAADLSDDAPRLAESLSDLPASSASLAPASPLARLLFAELLDRRAGRTAARAWLGPLRKNDDSEAATSLNDALLRRVEARVRTRLGT